MRTVRRIIALPFGLAAAVLLYAGGLLFRMTEVIGGDPTEKPAPYDEWKDSVREL